jgi:hypothetical protein
MHRARGFALRRTRYYADNMLLTRTRLRPMNADAPGERLVTEFDLIEPSGRWHKFRVRSRSERLRGAIFTAVALLISLALWALCLWPLVSTIRSIGSR